MKYPAAERQGRVFAADYLRWVMESGAVKEIGPEAFAVLTAVVMREDDTRYQRPVNFFNEQLADRCGITSVHSLIRARSRAIEAGLLHYEPGAKRRPGRYFTLGFPNELIGKAKGCVRESGGKAKPSIPIPFPNPKEDAASGESPSKGKNGKAKSPRFDPLSIEIPDPLRSSRFRSAWRDWCQHRREIKKPLTPTATTQQMRRLAEWGESRAVAAIEHTVGNGWVGLREPDVSRNGSPPPSSSSVPDRRPVTLAELRAQGERP